ncbi:phage tail tape measure protein [Bacteroides fragilis]|uniref:phage tail tape measure protein n=1 Tax=Bacteroides fragilis TaxID=817 RepID=UPI000EC7EC25|nr:phage tail tape measure protein [Bacteroides fragilis]DAZ13062.1 MAG TPA: minor tail protein [Caudoviricetes sp.]MCE8567162.1 phage tail tape measure protein [Bacteroides fragilis]MCM0197291.1 phage tail tape measure protein [Bacteroides fragilis]MCM0198124.1 phage tail tape measure protein [Bacteroides fragilis]MCM0208474.1 phage tail tape measure protein [Bacteroides fragilis]
MADLWFKIRADVSELDKAYKRLAEIEKMVASFNNKLSKSEPGGKAFKEISKQLTSLEKQHEQTLKKIASLETASQNHAQKEVENQRIISQAIKEAVSSEKLKQETSKASIQNSKAQIEAIKLELEELKKRRAFDNDAKKRAVSEEEVTRILNTQVKSIRQAEEQNKRLRIAVKNVVGEDKEANQLRATMNNRIQKNTEFIKRNTDAFVRQKMTIGQYKQEIKQAFAELQKGGNTMNNVKSIANGLSGVLKTKVSGGLSSVRDGVSTMIKGFVGAQAVISGFQKMVDAIKSGIHSIIDFESANSKLAAILGEAKTNINELIYDAKRLGATTRYTASEATALQIELAKLGFSKKEILDSTEYILKFAQATGAELPEAAALAGASIRMFGATTQETEKYVAAMAVATTKSALSFSYLQTAMPIVGPVAKAFNFTIEDTLALLGKLSDAGFDASMSATATRNIILNLADANGKLAKELGGNVKTLPEMVEGLVKLRDKGIDLASTLELTDKRSVAAFNAFLSGAEKINTLREAVTNVEGDLATMANTMTDNVQGAILGLSSAWEAFMLSFMNSTGPAKEVIDFFARGLRNIARDLASPDERQSMQNSESISLQKQQMQEFGVIDENLKRLRALYDEKVATGMDANQAEIEAKKEYLQSYRKELEKENKLYEDLQKEKQATQDKYQNASFWKQALFLEKTNHQYEKQIDLQVSGMAQLKGSMFKNESVIDAVENTQLTPQKTKTYKVKPEFKVSDYVDAHQHVKEIQKAAQVVKDAVIKSEIDIQQQQIDLKEEGNEKQLAQIRLNYDKRYQEIQKEERELLQKLQDEERKQWEKDNPDFKKKNLQFTSTITSLTPEQRAQFDKEYSLAYQKQEKDTKALLDKLLEKYRDYDAQRTAIEKQGNEEIAYLQSKRTDANAEEIDRAIKVAQDKIKEGVQQINDTQAEAATKDNDFFKLLFGDVSSMSFGALQNLISQAKQLREYLSGNGDAKGITFISPEQLKAIEKSPAELEKLKKALDKLLGTNKEGSNNKWEGIFTTFKKGFAELKGAKGFKEIAGAIGTISGASSEAAGELSKMFDEMGNTEVADALSGMQQVMSAVSNIGEGFAKGGLVGGIAAAVGEAANFIGQAFAANARHKAALKEIMNETIAQQREYNLLLMQQNLEYEKATTIFGTDAYGKAANAVKVMKEAVADLKDELAGTAEQKKDQSKDALFKKFFGVSNPQAELKKAYAGLANIEIKTGHKKTGLFGWGKGKDIYSSILDVYPQLVDANGKFDKSLAETIINTRTMSDESKSALQNMIDLAQQAEDAYNQLNDYFTDIFGSLGESMSDALVDAFKNGTDAAKAFTDSVSDMLETLAKQMVYSVTLAPLMEKAQKEMMDVMQNTGLSDEQKFNKWTGILNNLVDDAVNQQGLANRLLGEYQQAAKDKGFDIFGADSSTSQSSTKKGFATASQDSIDELNGRFTAGQIAWEETKNQAIEQTSLLSSINEKMSALCTTPETGSSDSIINAASPADGLREIIVSSFAQRDNFSGQIIEQLVAVKGEVSGLKGIVDEMRTTQSNGWGNIGEMTENVGKIAKANPLMNTKLDSINDNIKKAL